MEGLAGADLEAVGYELVVFGVDGSLADFGAAVFFVAEDGVADAGEMDADLVGAAGFEPAFDEGYEAEAFEDLPVGYCVLALFGVVGGAEAEAVGGVAHEVGVDGAFVCGHIAPDYRNVTAFDGVEEELIVICI